MLRFIFPKPNVKEPSKKEINDDSDCISSQTNKKPVPFDLNWILETKRKVPTADVAVGDEELLEKKNFLSYFGICRKKSETKEEPKNLDLLGKLKKGIHREAALAKQEIIASAIASVVAAGISHPFEVIKSQYQLVRQPKNSPIPIKRRQKIIYLLKLIYVTKGLKRFFRGHFESQRISLIHGVPMFWTYKRTLEYFNNVDKLDDWTDLKIFLAGFTSATIPVMLLRPLAVLRERRFIKHNVLVKHGPICAAHQLGKFERWRPLFRGTFSLFMHLGTQYGLRFLFYTKIRDELLANKSTSDKATSTNPLAIEVESIVLLSHFELLIAGALSAILGDTIVHPLDVMHSRLSMGPLARQQYRFNETCRRYGQCFLLILRKESLRAFYAGLFPSLLKSAINTAVQFAIYEKFRNWH